MRRLRRSLGIGAALSFLLLGAPVGGAGAAPEDPPTPQGEQASARRPVAEPTGRRASVAAMRSGRLNCGDVITQTTTLTADVGPCAGTAGIIIGADNIMLNLNGHTVFGVPGPGSGNDGGIRLPFRTGVRITGQPGNSGRTGTVTGFDAGVVINGGSGNLVENLVARDNIGPNYGQADLGDGIVLFHSANNRIRNNLVSHNGVYDGIGVLGVGSDHNTIEGNVVEDTVTSTIEFTFPGEGAGIILNPPIDGPIPSGPSLTGNMILNNEVRRNKGPGISNRSSIEGVIAGNVVAGNGFGSRSDGNGIGVSANREATQATNVLVRDNEVHGNQDSGIVINTFGNRILNNNAANNARPRVDPLFGTVYRSGFDLADFSPGPGCGNEWFGNIWGSGGYFPECVTAGGSGPVFEQPDEELPPPEEELPPPEEEVPPPDEP